MRANLDIQFHLIRHSCTNRNLENDLIGQDAEEPLNEIGIEQSKKLAARLKKENIQYDYIYCSNYLRAQQTAKIILNEAMAKNTPFITVPELREINQGDGKNKSRKEIYKDEFKDKWDFMGMSAHHPNGETLYEVQYRSCRWLEKEITDNPFMRSDKPLKIALFSHGMNIKCLLHYVLNFDHKMTWKIGIDNSSITSLHLKNGNWFIDRVNDTAHLL